MSENNFSNGLKIKVCGMRDDQNIKQLIEDVQPDYIGLIFYQKSQRLVENNLKSQTNQLIKKSSQLVGVFVDHSIEEIDQKAKDYQLDYIQLHGGKRHDYQFCQHLKIKGHKIIKVFRVTNESDISKELNQFSLNQDWNQAVDFLLFDTYCDQFGGLGERFDWSMIPAKVPSQYFLSGGLALENLAEVKNWIDERKKHHQSTPFALDLNSRFELSPAVKNIQLIEKFINQLG